MYVGMICFLALALLVTVPPDIEDSPFPRYVSEAMSHWINERKGDPWEHVIETVGTRVEKPGRTPGREGEETVALYFDRSGCARGWIRLRIRAGKGGALAHFKVEEFLGAECGQPPIAMNHVVRLQDAIERRDWLAFGEYSPSGWQFTVEQQSEGKVTSTLWDGQKIFADAVHLPKCDLFVDTLSCGKLRTAGHVTCVCRSSSRKIEFDFQMNVPVPGRAKLIAIREKPPR